jgi:glycosyltransferase involved in cell wall biosynthesis
MEVRGFGVALEDEMEPESLERRKTIAAIIPLYNGAKYINDALKSVVNQTRPADEILVVDDGSTDRGPDLVRDFAAKHPSVQLIGKNNGGQSSARNLGVACSHSDLIAFLDQDDMWRPSHLEVLAEPFDSGEHRNLGWVYSDLDKVDEDGAMVTRNLLPTLSTDHPKLSLFRCLDRDMFVLPTAALIARSAFEAMGGFDERLIGYEDDDLFLRMFRRDFENVYIPEALSVWRIHKYSTSYSSRMARSRLIYANKLFETFLDEPEMDLYYARDLIAPHFLRNAIADCVRAIRRNEAAQFREHRYAMRFYASRLRLRRRLLFRALSPLLGSFFLARLLYRSRTLPILTRRLAAISS